MLKRILWFVVINLAFMLTIGAVFFILNLLFPAQVASIMSGVRSNSNIGSIIIYSGIVGFISAFFSLALSRWFAKKFTGVQLITSVDDKYGFIYAIIERQAKQLGLKMPEVGYFDDYAMNAFATGATKNHSIVAFSTGILERMSPEALEAVAAHEMAHIKNGDMVTMTLIQGVVNTLVLTVSRVVANTVLRLTDSEIAYNIAYIVGQILFGIAAIPLTSYFSRKREFSADSEAAQLVGNTKMIKALVELRDDQEFLANSNSIIHDKDGLKAMCISGLESKISVFDTHPSLESRIQALQ